MTRSSDPQRTTPIAGRAFAWSEAVTEGIVWSVYEDGKTGYDALHIIEESDILQVFKDEARKIMLWEGEVKFDYHRNKKAAPPLPYEVQQLFGAIVHGLQENVPAEQWAGWFGVHKDRPMDFGLPVILTPRQKSTPQP